MSRRSTVRRVAEFAGGGSRIRTIGPSRMTSTRMGFSTWEAKSRDTRTHRWRKPDSNFSSLSGSVPLRAGGDVRGNHMARPRGVSPWRDQ